MAFEKPNFKWNPKPTRGDVKFRDHPGPEPQEAQSPGTEPLIRDNFTPEERDQIDDYLDALDDVRAGLDYLDDEFDKKLKDITLPYDSVTHPLVSDGQKCPDRSTPPCSDRPATPGLRHPPPPQVFHNGHPHLPVRPD